MQSEIAKHIEWTPGQWTEEDNDSQEEYHVEADEDESESLLCVYNEALSNLSEKSEVGKFTPLSFQLKTKWQEATEEEKEICIDKAIEGCQIVCKVIAPQAGDELLQSCVQSPKQDSEAISGELIALMQAHKNAPTRNLKTQILSLYAYRYSAKKLQKLHEPYERITDWQIKRARAHARECGSGLAVEKTISHRVRLNRVQVDHFTDFINRPYFYQDVAYGTRTLQMDSGEKLKMPNVIRTVTRSTMINQYLKFFEEEMVEPLSRTTLFRILQVRESHNESRCVLLITQQPKVQLDLINFAK